MCVLVLEEIVLVEVKVGVAELTGVSVKVSVGVLVKVLVSVKATVFV